MLRHISKDLFGFTAGVIAHGVNCAGAFNAGVARQVRKLYPLAYQFYLRKFQNGGWKLGDVQLVSVTEQLIIANCATQKGYGYANSQNVFADYKAIATVFKKLALLSTDKNLEIALPRIGAGLAGGDWNTIKTMLEEAAREYPQANLTVYSLE